MDYNQKVNLTAITSPEGIEDRHFPDSLLFAAQPEVAGKMVDVGAGAGFPGHRGKNFQAGFAADPDGAHRQAGGLFEVRLCGELGLTGVEFAKERAEEAARKSGVNSLMSPAPVRWRPCRCWRILPAAGARWRGVHCHEGP